MESLQLRHPPIIEALVEVKWDLRRVGPQRIDPHYQLLLGSFYERIKDTYPHHEALPIASVPDELTPAMVKHRFRKERDGWPLVQIGPGILSVNVTEDYETFRQFQPLACEAVNVLHDVYPEPMRIVSLVLRYIDGVTFDYGKNNVCELLEKMHIPLNIPAFVAEDKRFEPQPKSLVLQTTFRCTEPPGMATLSVSTGKKKGQPAIIWEQTFRTTDVEVPDMPEGFENWVNAAHTVIEGWFRSIIEGELEREFNNVQG